ncbi:MAG: serine/threonine-protein kinase [Planctomycetota bacterium]
MTPSNSPACRRCGAVLPSQAGELLCPACLLSGALADGTDETATDETVTVVPGSNAAPTEPTEFPRDFGSYRLLGALGSGGMGSVFEAEHVTTKRRVALKVLGRELDSPEARQRFLREGRLAAGVSHPNSLYVFGTEEIAGRPAITMEIASGGTLDDRVKQRGPLPVAEAVDAMLDVISGLEAAYAAGVLHRDIKPSNCFVGPDASVKIGDFGLSVSTLANDDSYATDVGIVLGTPAFASPEQLRGRDLDVRSDLYSVGATLFTLLSGQAPFRGRNAVEVVAAALEETPKSLTEIRDDVPEGLARIVTRCLAKQPEQRYADGDGRSGNRTVRRPGVDLE